MQNKWETIWWAMTADKGQQRGAGAVRMKKNVVNLWQKRLAKIPTTIESIFQLPKFPHLHIGVSI